MSSNGSNPLDSPNRVEYTARDVAVMGKDEYKQQRRLDRILDAHDKVAQIDDESLWSVAFGDIGTQGRNIVLQNAVKAFVRELLTPLREHAREADGADRYWYGNETDPLGKISFQYGPDEVFRGLGDYLYSERHYKRSKQQVVTRRNEPPKNEVQEELRTMPETVSWNAFYLAKEFAANERGLDLSVEDDTLARDDVTPDY